MNERIQFTVYSFIYCNLNNLFIKHIVFKSALKNIKCGKLNSDLVQFKFLSKLITIAYI